jgi:putative two-component system response regulator
MLEPVDDSPEPTGHAKDYDKGFLLTARAVVENSSPPRQALPSALHRPVSSKNLFINGLFPILVITPDFKITFANDACKKLFSNIAKIEDTFFISVFSGYFKIDDIKNIREVIMKGRNCYSWKGKAFIKSRSKTTVETRVYLFPLDRTDKAPTEFAVMFDDVTEETKHLLRNVFMSLLEASKLKDNDTGKHIVRVNYYSEALAKALPSQPGYDIVDADFIDNIAFLAAMHDVGKIGTPDDILNKEGPLSAFEWDVMKEHTINGAFILSTYPNPMAREIAVAHHEKWNGSGYPYRLDGETIPLSARIVSLADVYDALRMKRSYKPPYTHEVTIKKILEARGTQFDPRLVDIMLTVSDTFKEIYETYAD